MPKKKGKIVAIYLKDPALWQLVKRCARRQGLSISQLTSKALIAYCQPSKPDPTPTPYTPMDL